ncbi:MAG: Alanine racemase [Candidatus Curtissbacteria bacterium GW2011_GWD1_40_8]|nr:MAG: Alanine racemase [Candidatus Curtissbacteria bacterium GW2011_GWD1_40_8]
MIKFIRKILGKEYIPLNKILISQKRLVGNYQYLKKLQKNLKIAPVLKSNAYGHGIVQTAKILESQKPPMFCVDSLYEAYLLLKARVKTPILIMGYIHPISLKVKKLPFAYAVFDHEQLEVINKYQKGCQVHIKVDTGMHRLGIMMQDLPEFIEKLRDYKNIKVTGLMSHLAYQESIKEELSKKQLINFQKARTFLREAGFELKWLHLAASGGVLSKDMAKISKISNMARVGLALYGIDPTGKHPKLNPVLKVTSKIILIKKLKKGDKVGYSGTFVCDREMSIGILPIGYNDGVDRNLSNKGVVIVADKPCPIIGNISMNITTIDLSPVINPKMGQEVIIFSDNAAHSNSITNASQTIERIPYELLTHLSEISLKREVI